MPRSIIPEREQEHFPRGVKAAMIVFLALLGGMAARLFTLQIINGEEYRLKAVMNQLRVIPVKAPRGRILDRNGRVLAEVRPAFSVAVVPADIASVQETAAGLARILGTPAGPIVEKVGRAKGFGRYIPIVVARDIPRTLLARLEARLYHMPGVRVVVEGLRSYPGGPLAAHVIGYLGEISPGEMEQEEFGGYLMGDMIGKSGLERRYEEILHGRDGYRLVEVDALGRETREVGEVPARKGNDITVSIDLDVQRKIEEWLVNPGSAVAMLVETGEVLAMVSRPGFDPNLFSAGISTAAWKALLEDPRNPLTNRVIQGLYPPGSVIKPLVATAALAAGSITPDQYFACAGAISLGQHQFRCWLKGGHGMVAMHRGIVESCDVYFYRVGERVGPREMARWGRLMGLGAISGIDLPGEKAGLVPDQEWKKRVRGADWYKGETYHMAIGQGYYQLTPLQIVRYMAAVGTGKTPPPPHFLTAVRAYGGTGFEPVRTDYSPEDLPVSQEIRDEVRRAMEGVVTDAGGTGRRAAVKGVSVAGKTGTAQVVSSQTRGAALPDDLGDHAWFAAFAPSYRPQVAIAVMLEHGGHGGSVAAPGAAVIIRGMQEAGYFGPPPELPKPAETEPRR